MDTLDLQAFAAEFITSTRDYVFIRPEDRLLILRPNKIHHLNRTATEMLTTLYAQATPDVDAVVRQTAARYDVPEAQVAADLDRLLRSLSLVLQDQDGAAPAVRRTPFGSHFRELPVLSEIALTYRCQNRCTFCYASSPDRGPKVPEMTTAQVKRILDIIVDDARVPTVSFTGGEPTLRPDLPELIAYAKSRRLRTKAPIAMSKSWPLRGSTRPRSAWKGRRPTSMTPSSAIPAPGGGPCRASAT